MAEIVTKLSVGRQRLQEFTSGHPIAVQGLREYKAVTDAAVKLIGAGVDWGKRYAALQKALAEGGFIK